MIHDIKEKILNIDTVKEMFDLWYEVTFLKILLNEFMNQNPSLCKGINNETFDDCRAKAQLILKAKFKIDLDFSNPVNKE